VTQQAGQLIAGRYLLGRCLARGGMGSVWEAQHVELEARVALKLLRQELGEDAAHVERFRREARAAAKLKSPNVVAIYDCGVDRGTPYIAMEFLEGEDLELRLGRLGRLEAEESLMLLDQAARGLAVAHAAGLVHRDVKPANLFIERLPAGERLKVVDFGIARPLSGDSTLTTGNSVWGSPAYMSPEQARGRLVDQRTDVWALAAVFFRMLTGQLPFPGRTEHDTIVEVCTGRPRAPSELDPSLPKALDELFVRAFAKDPTERTASVELLAQEAAEALGIALSPFVVPPSRPSHPSFAELNRPSTPGPRGPGRMTETMPLPGDTGPTAVTTPSALGKAPSSRRLGLLAGAALAISGAMLWSARPRAPEKEAPPSPLEHEPPTGSQVPAGRGTAIATSVTPAPSVEHAPSAPTAGAPAPPARERPSTSRPKASPQRAPSAPAEAEGKDAARAPADPLFGLPLEGDGSK